MRPIRTVLILYPSMVLPDGDLPSYTFPMGAGYIAAALERAGYDVHCLDAVTADRARSRPRGGRLTEHGLSTDEIMERIRRLEPDAIGFSCQFSVQYEPTRALIEAVRRWDPEVTTIIGGTHSSAQPREVMAETGVDFVVIAEGESTIVQLFQTLEARRPFHELDGLAWREGGEIRVNPKTRFILDLDGIPHPARHLFDMEAYFRTPRGWGEAKKRRRISMITSRGCPFRCSFCGIHLNTGKKFRMRSAADVLREMEDLIENHGIREIMFEDDNISLHRRRFKEILQGMISRGYDLAWSATSGMALWTLDEEILELMKASGCVRVYLGIESGSERVLKDVIHKHLTDKDEIRRRVAMIKRFDLSTVGFWVLGNPGETKKEMWETLDFARELELDFNQVLIALPYKGTQLHEICAENGYFAGSDALDPNKMLETKAMIRTPEFTPEDVLAIQQAGRFLAVVRRRRGLLRTTLELFRRHGSFSFRVLQQVALKQLGFYGMAT